MPQQKRKYKEIYFLAMQPALFIVHLVGEPRQLCCDLYRFLRQRHN